LPNLRFSKDITRAVVFDSIGLLYQPIQLAEAYYKMDAIRSDSPSPEDPPDNAAAPSRNLLKMTLAPALLMIAGVAAVGLIAKLLPLVMEDSADKVLRVVLAAAAICMAVAMSLRHRKQWVMPSDNMRRLIHEIRLGRAPIEEFSEYRPGSLGELSEEVKLLLQDLRLQRQAVTELQDEVHQRIAHRTSVLERTITTLRNQVVRDPVTGLHNRRMLDQLLPQLITQCAAEKKQLSLMMIDVDYFKPFIETLGHPAGDQLLRSVGQIVTSTIRETDFACRYGDDEFVLLLPGCEADTAREVGERLHSLVHSLAETYKVPNRPGLSIGVCALAEVHEYRLQHRTPQAA
jgi:diguanylate cyclase (GGDEF)-like protein